MPDSLGLALLGGLTTARFMRRHWQREPLLVRRAWPGITPPLSRRQLFALAARDDVESRLVVRHGSRWTLRRGPLSRRALPPLAQPGWTLLVQGVDLHDDAAHALQQPFRFIADARFDDVMVSYASDSGGVGAHVDAYDVFLLQLHGRRRWRLGPVADTACVDDVPLKLLRRFEPTIDVVVEPGDLLYLPPMWGHDGVAVGECMTASIGFRAPTRDALLRELLPRMADEVTAAPGDERWYRDAGARPTARPGAIPPSLQRFADAAARALRGDRGLWQRVLGQWLTEPKPQLWFEPGAAHADLRRGVRLDRRSRMMYDARHVYLNGERHSLRGADARMLRMLADRRRLEPNQVQRLSAAALAKLASWVEAGWIHGG